MQNKRAAWQLYLTATATGQRPSALVHVADAWAALQFDNAVVLVGRVIENAAQEQEQVGPKNAPQWRAKYHLDELLRDDFRLPRAPTAQERERASLDALKQMARSRHSGVKYTKVATA